MAKSRTPKVAAARLVVNSKVASLTKARSFTRGDGDAETANYSRDDGCTLAVQKNAVWMLTPIAGEPVSG